MINFAVSKWILERNKRHNHLNAQCNAGNTSNIQIILDHLSSSLCVTNSIPFHSFYKHFRKLNVQIIIILPVFVKINEWINKHRTDWHRQFSERRENLIVIEKKITFFILILRAFHQQQYILIFNQQIKPIVPSTEAWMHDD